MEDLLTVTTVDVQAAIDQILPVGRQLAYVQLYAAMVGGGDSVRIVQAQANIADAGANISAGNFADAVLDYKKAWTNAVKAL